MERLESRAHQAHQGAGLHRRSAHTPLSARLLRGCGRGERRGHRGAVQDQEQGVLRLHHSLQPLPGSGRSAFPRVAPGGAGIRAAGWFHRPGRQQRPGVGPQMH